MHKVIPPLRLSSSMSFAVAAMALLSTQTSQARAPRKASPKLPNPRVVAPAHAISSAAQVSLARARQLEKSGVDVLAERELLHAISLAPRWVEPQRELARFYSRRAQWNEASAAWRNVLFLQRSDREATQQFDLARRNLRLAGARRNVGNLVELGQDSQNQMAGADLRSTLTVAQTNERLAQNDVPASDTGSITGGDSAVAVETLPDAPSDTTPSEAAPAVGTQYETGNTDVSTQVPTWQAPATNRGVSAPARSGAGIRTTTSRRAPVRRAATTRRATRRVAARRAPVRAAVAPRNVRFAPVVSGTRRAAAWPLVNRAVSALKARNYPGALALYQRAAKTDPNNIEARQGVAQTLLIQKRYPEAIRAYRAIVAASPTDPRANRGLADALAFSGRYPEAIAANNRILARSPRDYQAALQNAQISTWTRNYPQSERYFRTALAARPNDADAWTAWGESLSYSERGTRARSAFERALQIRPNYAPALVGLGNLYNWSNDYPNAIVRYRAALRTQPNNIGALVGLGDALTFSSGSQEATGYYRRALTLSPNSV
ncbi:MAG TPA: tetratricopeptide repeat protein, partial [Abditibacteriaceae bacterium]